MKKTTITPEDYVSYPLALALKKAGFDEPCDHYWYKVYTDSDKMEMRQASADDYNNDDWSVPHCSAPHIYQAQKWLREKKGIAINVIAHGCHEKYREGKYHWEEIHLPNSKENGPQWRDWFIYGKHPLFDTYEEALSDGLSQMLELITKGE